MKTLGALVGVLFVAVLVNSQSNQLNACTACNYLMGEIEKQTQSATTRDQIIAVLDKICPTISSFVDIKQCESFMRVFGNAAVDLLLSKTSAAAICKDGLQICSDSDATKYEVLFPHLIGNDLMYEVSEMNFAMKSQFHYKIFLGDSFPSNNQLVVNLVDSFCKMSLVVQSRTLICHENCTMVVDFPDTKTWYKFDLTPTQISGTPTKFDLQIIYTEMKDTPTFATDDVGGPSVLSWLVLLMTVLPLFIGCCCVCAIRKYRRRTCRGYRCRTINQKDAQPHPPAEPETKKDSVEIPMEPVAPSSESYYFPQQQMGPAPPAYVPYFFPQQPQYTPFQVQPHPPRQ